MRREPASFVAALACVLQALAFSLTQPVLAQHNDTVDVVTDDATGVKLAIPQALLTERKNTKWGRNWSSLDKSIDVDTLAYPKGKNLSALHDELRRIPGRTITQDELGTNGFVLAGRTSDGHSYYVQMTEQNGIIRGFSATYTKHASYGPQLVEQLVKSFVAFPSSAQEPQLPSESKSASFEKPLLSVAAPQSTPNSPARSSTIQVMPNIGSTDEWDEATLSPDGRLVATYNAPVSSGIKIWDSNTGRPLRRLQYYAYFTALVFLPNGKALITGHKDGAIKLWDLETGECKSSFIAPEKKTAGDDVSPIRSLWVDPTNKILVSGGSEMSKSGTSRRPR